MKTIKNSKEWIVFNDGQTINILSTKYFEIDPNNGVPLIKSEFAAKYNDVEILAIHKKFAYA